MPLNTPYSPGDTIESAKDNADKDGLASGENDTDNNSLALFRSEILGNFVGSGLVASIISGLQASITSGAIYYSGVRVAINAVGSKTFTASKDTYVDVSNIGVYAYPEAELNATPPALTANSIRIAKVTTNVSAITTITQVGTDGLGVSIYPLSSLSSERVTKPIISLYRSGDAVVSGETWRHIAFDTVLFNRGFYVNFGASGKPITVPFTGIYRIGMRASIVDGPDGQQLGSFGVNSSSVRTAPYLYREHRSAQNPFTPQMAYHETELNQGDTVTFWYYANGTANHRLKGGMGSDSSQGTIEYLGR